MNGKSFKFNNINYLIVRSESKSWIQCLDETGALLTFYHSDNPTHREYLNLNKLNFNSESVTNNLTKKLASSGRIYNLKYFYSGTDPEIFVENKDGSVIPAFDFLPDKNNGVNHSGEGKLYWDGFQAEFDISPGSCLDGVVGRTRRALIHLNSLVKQKYPGAKLSAKSVIEVDPKVLENSKPEHVAFGCSPSYNVYDLPGPVLDGRTTPLRSAGGHLHFGIGKKDKEVITKIVKGLDAVLGVCCVSLFEKYDDARRRSMYGLAGEFRLPKHGIEYRVLSNAWLMHPLLMNIVFDLARVILFQAEIGTLEHMWKVRESTVIKTINNHDVKSARKIIAKNKEALIKLLRTSYGEYMAPLIYNIIFNGGHCVIKDINDVENNWQLQHKNTVGDYYVGRRVANSLDFLKKKVA